ncbi:mitogen-activated protein kinase kinase kinase 20-like [Gastrolobium bilobum]|uniref:mitogen-activated protein kinase kinase kinase 20-like n=1 Tax=Gastrolobium bilobum TaxID=150636 RepID=UPI002AAFB2DA|nr:mitogen-activated protein kinase kinase kinase 20-like [Gastrolobium bilobum]
MEKKSMFEWEELKKLKKGSNADIYLAVITAPQEWKENVVIMKSSRPYSMESLQKEEKIMRSFIGCEEIHQCSFSQFTEEKGKLIYNLSMECALFGSMGDLIRKRALLESEVRVYTRMLLKGLSLIHKSGIVHCDLNPDNILLFPSCNDEASYKVKIANFGLSKTKEETIKDKIKFRGTPFYMSPESVMGEIETPLDIWSLGCTVIEMVTGLPIWSNLGSKADLMFKLAFLKEAPEIPDGISHECKDFLSKCFIKDPSKRWSANMLLNHPFLFAPYDMFRGYESFSMVVKKKL